MTATAIHYRPDIDGLRALAVLPVVFYHAGFDSFSGGYVGVDVFFVISGFLITSIILPDISGGEFRVSSFYARRARRLFPALFSVALFSCIPAYFLLMPQELEDFGQSVATTAVFASNFMFFSEAGYFDGPAELKPLLHTWSLAIEEQYYLLFPALLLLIRRRLSGHYLGATLALFVASLVISIWSVHDHPSAAFYLLPSRTWELLLGSLLAMHGPVQFLAPRVREWLVGLGLLMIICAVLFYDSETTFPGLAALLPAFGTALVIEGGRLSATRVGRVLSLKPVVFVGLISYSLYLWHWPVLVYAKHWLVRPLMTVEALALVVLSVLLAVASWRFIEKPFRGRGALLDQRSLFRLSAGLMATAIVIGLVFDESEGLPGRLPPMVSAIADVARDKPPERDRCEGIDPAEVTYDRLCRLTGSAAKPTFIFWGDSHAAALMRAARAAAGNSGTEGLNASSNGCVPLLGVDRQFKGRLLRCDEFNQRVFELIAAHPELKTIVLAARWARYAEAVSFGEEPGPILYLKDANGVATDPAENREIYRQALKRTVIALGSLHREVVILGPIPEVGHDVPNTLAKAAWHGRDRDLRLPVADFFARQAFVLETFQELQASYPFARFIPLHDRLCRDALCDVSEDGLPIYFDDDHLSSRGVDRMLPVFQAILDSTGQTPVSAVRLR